MDGEGGWRWHCCCAMDERNPGSSGDGRNDADPHEGEHLGAPSRGDSIGEGGRHGAVDGVDGEQGEGRVEHSRQGGLGDQSEDQDHGHGREESASEGGGEMERREGDGRGAPAPGSDDDGGGDGGSGEEREYEFEEVVVQQFEQIEDAQVKVGRGKDLRARIEDVRRTADYGCLCFRCRSGYLCRCALGYEECCHRFSPSMCFCRASFGRTATFVSRSFWGGLFPLWILVLFLILLIEVGAIVLVLACLVLAVAAVVAFFGMGGYAGG